MMGVFMLVMMLVVMLVVMLMIMNGLGSDHVVPCETGGVKY